MRTNRVYHAVDSHTEARISARMRGHREGKRERIRETRQASERSAEGLSPEYQRQAARNASRATPIAQAATIPNTRLSATEIAACVAARSAKPLPWSGR